MGAPLGYDPKTCDHGKARNIVGHGQIFHGHSDTFSSPEKWCPACGSLMIDGRWINPDTPEAYQLSEPEEYDESPDWHNDERDRG